MEENGEKCVKSATEQNSIKDHFAVNQTHEEPQPTDSQNIQQKLKEMKEALNTLHAGESLEEIYKRFKIAMHNCPCLEDAGKVIDAWSEFSKNYLYYEYALKYNIKEIEKSQSVLLSKLLPLCEAPKYVDFADCNKIKEAFNAKGDNSEC